MPGCRPARSSMRSVAMAGVCARRAAPCRHTSAASAEFHVRTGSVVMSRSGYRVDWRAGLEANAEGVVLRMDALGAEEDRTGRNVLVIELQVEPQPFAIFDGEVHAIGGIKRVKVDDHLVATVQDVDPIVFFQLDHVDVLERAFGAQDGVENMFGAGAVRP